jgi:predicted phage gp36 major capsid-like protein
MYAQLLMQQRKIILQAVAAIALVWLTVFAIRSWAGSKKITAEKIDAVIDSAEFANWSSGDQFDTKTTDKREKKIREIANLTNQLDFQEREKNRENRSGDKFFRLLNPSERNLFIDLTVAESMNKFMQALDQMPAAERKKFVAQGLAEIEKGKTAEEIERTKELGEDVLEKITQEGMRAYFEKASTDTKLDLAPLMESMNDVMQGMRGGRLGPGKEH